MILTRTGPHISAVENLIIHCIIILVIIWQGSEANDFFLKYTQDVTEKRNIFARCGDPHQLEKGTWAAVMYLLPNVTLTYYLTSSRRGLPK